MSNEQSTLLPSFAGNGGYEELEGSYNAVKDYGRRHMVKIGLGLGALAMAAVVVGQGAPNMFAQQIDGSQFFAELLRMAPPSGPSGVNWKDCQESGTAGGMRCYKTAKTKAEKDSCAKEGEAAAHACYKEMGKSFGAYWAGVGKEYRDYYKTYKGGSRVAADIDGSMLFEELLAMAPPAGPEGASWKDCKESATAVALDCYKLNPVDEKGCADQGKAAAHGCYKNMGKEFSTYWKQKGAEFKGMYKAYSKPPTTAADPLDGSIFLTELMGMAAPAGPPAVNWKDCQEAGVVIGMDCNKLGVDAEGCSAEAKDAAKACFSDMGKGIATYWANVGKQYKDMYAPAKKTSKAP